MLEKQIEEKLRKSIKAMGGLCLKWVSPGYTGVPDRIVLLPGGRIIFVELKAPGKKERPRQRYVQSVLKGLGFTVFESVDSIEKIDEVIWCATRMMYGDDSE